MSPFITKSEKAFSLLEMLVVLAIMAVMVSISIPMFDHLFNEADLGSCGKRVIDELVMARQKASSRNLVVEVRFYFLKAEENGKPSSKESYRAMQSFLLEDEKTTPLNKVLYLPSPVIFAVESKKLTSLLTSEPETDSSQKVAPSGEGLNRYVAFHFHPNGATDLVADPAFLTLVSQRQMEKARAEGKETPRDFFTIQIDPKNGRIQSHRP